MEWVLIFSFGSSIDHTRGLGFFPSDSACYAWVAEFNSHLPGTVQWLGSCMTRQEAEKNFPLVFVEDLKET